MKKSELKNMIKECVREVLFEEGVLSDVIAEVAHGMVQAQALLVENKPAQQRQNEVQESLKAEKEESRRKQLLETKRKMLDAIGGERMQGVFEGTEPLRESSKVSPHSPLSGRDANDAGVDISGILGIAGQRWQQLK